ncbi:MAG: hypothetical protein IT361_05030 [Gemmatimonadaceae bacterium]|nr:hypothetical protein [Gemmatimonadaceae bacterium]
MAAFFPQVTGTFRLDEPPGLRRFTMSAVGMGALTGLVVRLYRLVTLSVGPSESMIYVGAAFVLGQLLILAMATVHLGNFTLRRWLYLVPLFTVAEAAAEVIVSLGLTALGFERMGSRAAVLADWPTMALLTFLWRGVVLVAYAIILAGVVQLVRYLLLRHEKRGHTLDAVTAEQPAAVDK